MSETDHDILIELRSDVQHIKAWTVEHTEKHQRESSIRLKFILPLYAAVLAGAAKLIFWK